MFERLRIWIWRRQRLVAAVYLAGLGLLLVALIAYVVWFPPTLDTAAAVALRSMVHDAVAAPVAEARRYAEAGRLDAAERILERFLDEHADTQPAQLATAAFADASILLSEIYVRTDRPGRAARRLETLTLQMPRNYYGWYRRGLLESDSGDVTAAAESFAQAFRLTTNHPDVAAAYLKVLDEMVRYEDVARVADQYERGCRRARPRVEAKIGVARGALQRWGLDAAGIPVEHGAYTKSVVLRDLPRGDRRALALPDAMFARWHGRSRPLYVQLQFEHIYDGLRLDGLRVRGADGAERELPAGDLAVHELHRPHSGAGTYLEIRTDLDLRDIAGLTVVYSCPTTELPDDVTALVDKARENVKARGGVR